MNKSNNNNKHQNIQRNIGIRSFTYKNPMRKILVKTIKKIHQERKKKDKFMKYHPISIFKNYILK